MSGRVKDSGSGSWGLIADQPEDDEGSTYSGRRRESAIGDGWEKREKEM